MNWVTYLVGVSSSTYFFAWDKPSWQLALAMLFGFAIYTLIWFPQLFLREPLLVEPSRLLSGRWLLNQVKESSPSIIPLFFISLIIAILLWRTVINPTFDVLIAWLAFGFLWLTFASLVLRISEQGKRK